MATPSVVDLESRIGAWYPDAVSLVPIERIIASVPRPTPVERVAMHLVIVPSGGCATHLIDFIEHPLSSRDVLHVRPGQVQRWMLDASSAQSHANLAGDVVLIRPDIVAPPLFDRLIEVTHTPLDSRTAEALRTALGLLRMVSASPTDNRHDHAVTAAVATTVLELVAQAGSSGAGPNGQSSTLLAAFRALVDHEHAQRRTVDWFARRLAVSSRTLHRMCTEAAGQTPKQLIDDRRALEARRLLGHTELTVVAVARELGFDDPGNFSRFFVRTTGVTVGAFRRAVRG